MVHGTFALVKPQAQQPRHADRDARGAVAGAARALVRGARQRPHQSGAGAGAACGVHQVRRALARPARRSTSGCRPSASSSASSSACSRRCRSASRSAGTTACARFLDPLINFFRALPPIALIPLVIVYFGIGETAKMAILFYASFFAGVIVMVEGIGQISPIYVKVVAHARRQRRRDLRQGDRAAGRAAHPHRGAGRARRGLGDAGRLGADRRAAGPGRADPERVVVLPARHHLCRHHLHRPDRPGDGPRCCAPRRAGWWPGRTGSHELR